MKGTNKKGAKRTDQSTAKLQNTTENIRHWNNITKNQPLSTIESYRTILQLIGSGEVIISSTNGYFRSETPAELKKIHNSRNTSGEKYILYS